MCEPDILWINDLFYLGLRYYENGYRQTREFEWRLCRRYPGVRLFIVSCQAIQIDVTGFSLRKVLDHYMDALNSDLERKIPQINWQSVSITNGVAIKTHDRRV